MRHKVDLHIHSNYSDGHYPPAKLLERAAGKGITTISITDHDTISAYKDIKKTAGKFDIEIVTGVELSSDIADKEVHILGYFIDTENKELQKYLDFFKEERIKRAERIVRNLNTLGLKISIQDVLKEAKKSVVCRPHIAKALVKKKQVGSYQEAFINYLGNHAPAYEKKIHISPSSCFKIIADAGGLSFIAHPFNLPDHLINELIKAGVDGIEVEHPSYSQIQRRYFTNLASQYFLLTSGGSDFHGGKKDDEKSLGKYYISKKMLDQIKKSVLKKN